MKETFKSVSFTETNMNILEHAIDTVERYQAMGYVITLRQLYYQLVAKNVIPNKEREYKRLSRLLTKARMSGLVDWSAIEDRNRSPTRLGTFKDLTEFMGAVKGSFRIDMWENQPKYVEVWIEKDALSSVFWQVCQTYNCVLMVNKGYGSTSSIYDAYERMSDAISRGSKPIILYFGDHDPSGMQMTEDVESRLQVMLGETDQITVERVALNMDQIREHDPPVNPVKFTDSRSPAYVDRYGDDCWEIDALPPDVLQGLVKVRIDGLIDHDIWDEDQERHDRLQGKLEWMIEGLDVEDEE